MYTNRFKLGTMAAALVVAVSACVPAGTRTAEPSTAPQATTAGAQATNTAPLATVTAVEERLTATPMPENVIVVPDLTLERSGNGGSDGNVMYVPEENGSDALFAEISAGMVLQIKGQSKDGHWLLVTVLETKPVSPVEPSQLVVGQTGWVIPYWVGLPTPLLPAEYPITEEMPSPEDTGLMFQAYANTRIDAELATLEATGAPGDLVNTADAIVQLTFTPQP